MPHGLHREDDLTIHDLDEQRLAVVLVALEPGPAAGLRAHADGITLDQHALTLEVGGRSEDLRDRRDLGQREALARARRRRRLDHASVGTVAALPARVIAMASIVVARNMLAGVRITRAGSAGGALAIAGRFRVLGAAEGKGAERHDEQCDRGLHRWDSYRWDSYRWDPDV